MDLLCWIETERLIFANYNIVAFMTGRGDASGTLFLIMVSDFGVVWFLASVFGKKEHSKKSEIPKNTRSAAEAVPPRSLNSEKRPDDADSSKAEVSCKTAVTDVSMTP